MDFRILTATAAVGCALAGTGLAQTVDQAAGKPAAEAPVSASDIPPPIPVPPVPVSPAPPVPTINVAAPPAPLVPPQLAGSFVYVYSYLDVREEHFGKVMLDSLNAKLVTQLKAAGVDAKVVSYKTTDVYKQTLADDEYKMSNQDVTRGYRDSTYVPIEKVIAEKRADEQASGAKYRLIVFPKTYTSSGAWRFYTLLWNLYDIETNKKVWSFAYKGENLIWWKEDENPDGRSTKIVDGFMEAAKAAGATR